MRRLPARRRRDSATLLRASHDQCRELRYRASWPAAQLSGLQKSSRQATWPFCRQCRPLIEPTTRFRTHAHRRISLPPRLSSHNDQQSNLDSPGRRKALSMAGAGLSRMPPCGPIPHWNPRYAMVSRRQRNVFLSGKEGRQFSHECGRGPGRSPPPWSTAFFSAANPASNAARDLP